MGRKCEVCKEEEFKYKCPACLVPYCSVDCFKKHKELCQKLQPPVIEAIEVRSHLTKTFEVEEENWIVSRERLYALAKSKEIRDTLKSNELQELILRIDSSEEPEQELDKAMRSGGYFHDFAEKVLDIISERDEIFSGTRKI